MPDPTPQQVAQAAQLACLLEASAPKPGNVSPLHDFADVRFEDFLWSALAIGPALERADRDGVGQVVWNAVAATQRLGRTNTNLGMLLLLAPLARGCFVPGSLDLRAKLRLILSGLTVDDARLAYAAIRLARPGGLGQVSEATVDQQPAIDLRHAMALAQERDSIAREYVTTYAITFEITHPALREAWLASGQLVPAIVQAALVTLAQVPDTLIVRKRGSDVARQVSAGARDVVALGGMFSEAGRNALADFDRSLRDDLHTLNPGTTADLVAAAIFVHLLAEEPLRGS